MHDLPSVPALLALARDVLLYELTPLLPEERHADARLVADAIAIAEHKAAGDGEPTQLISRELELFYERDGSHPAPPQPSTACGGGKGRGNAGEMLLRRFAHDLRSGAFEASPRRDRAARAILWRLTIAKLRQYNPGFLVPNGFD
jgi:hypothetical protein